MKKELEVLEKENTRLKKKIDDLKDLVLLDFLTKAYNRHAFADFLKKSHKEIQWTKSHKSRRRQLSQFSILLIDIDDFKKFNDNFGHLHGDKILKKAAKLLEECVREFDIVARWGGEEFAIILRGATLEQARNKAEFILEQARKRLPITFSIGAIQSNSKYTADQMFKRVDKALFKAKEKGKDQIVTI
jgi:diguanylate cyclase (GGDEF)-like protein